VEFYDLALGAHDVPRPVDSPDPVRRSYVLCSNPSSGSTLLSEALHGLGCIGTPIEYFDGDDTMAACAQRWGCETVACYVRCLHRNRTTADGMLAAKVHWYQLQEMTAALYIDAPRANFQRQRAALELAFPKATYVNCIREDRNRQAVSWAIARATGHWTTLKGRGPMPPVEYDFAAIDQCRREIEHAERQWVELFEAAGIEPMTVTYEQLASDYAGTVAAVARFVGGDVEADDVPVPRLAKQANAQSRALLQRYTQERAVRADL